MDLRLLSEPCKEQFSVSPFAYEESSEKQRAFSYSTPGGRVIDHFPKVKPNTLDLFAGAGGMTLGFQRAGFAVKWAVENNALAAATLRANASHEGGVNVFTEDVRRFLKRSIAGHPSYPSVGDVDHIHASPPCKGFSRANRYGGCNDWTNNQQTRLFVKAVQHFKPPTATFENVPGLLMKGFKHYLQGVTSSLLRIGYQVRVAELNSSDYGDPQNRRRVILWAARADCILPSPPTPTHGSCSNANANATTLLPKRTTKDALRLLEEHSPVSPRTSGAISIRGTVVYNHICSKAAPKDDDFVLRPDVPSRTVLARSRPYVHYKHGRFLTVREAACLQSFPASYQFFGGIADQYRQVGNAVPIRLASAVARSVAVVHGLS